MTAAGCGDSGMRLVLFDCDGTLVDSAAAIHGCMVRTFAGCGLAAPSEAATKAIIGLSLDIALARLAGLDDPESIAALGQSYRTNFITMRGEPGFSEPVFPGIPAVLETLARRDDITMGIVTGKSRRGVKAVLATHGFGDLFSVIRTADDCPSKPHPAMVIEACREAGIAPAETVVVGDAIYDIEMARAAGATAIGVAWGYHDDAALIQAGAARVLGEPAELLGFFERGESIHA
jgi:phosphoglycolate phosphatase